MIKILVTFNSVDIFGPGIDLILQINNPKIKNDGKFFTDSNGIFEMERNLGKKLETSVFPTNLFFQIKDQNSKQVYFTNISQGVTSLA